MHATFCLGHAVCVLCVVCMTLIAACCNDVLMLKQSTMYTMICMIAFPLHILCCLLVLSNVFKNIAACWQLA